MECQELHVSCKLRWAQKGDRSKVEMHEAHITALRDAQDAIASFGKKAKRPAKPSEPAKLGKVAIPTIEEAVFYAFEIKLPKREADRFFDYFQSNGWKVGGKTAIKDWKAALRNWRRNWEERNPEAARMERNPVSKLPQVPAGWEDWVSEYFPESSAVKYASASAWMRDEFYTWLKSTK